MSIRSNAEQEKREAAVSSHSAYIATNEADKLDTISSHQKAMGAHTEAFELNRDVGNKRTNSIP